MKKQTLFSILAAAVVIICGFATSCSTESEGAKANKEVLNDTFVFYANLGEINKKGGFDELLTESNRRLLATVIASSSEGADYEEYAMKLLVDPSASGINYDTPIYGYINVKDDSVSLVIVADVENAKNVDKFIAFLEEMSGESVGAVRKGDVRQFSIDDLHIAYNNNRLVAVVDESLDYGDSPNKVIAKALNRPDADLSAYEKYDIAYSVNIKKLVDILIADKQRRLDYSYEYLVACDEWEREWEMEYINSLEKEIEMLKNSTKDFEENARATIGITSKAGRIVAEMSVDGYNSEYKLDKKVSNEFLEYVNNNALLVANLAVDGNMVSEILDKYFTAEYAKELGLNRNEFNLYVGIASDAFKSINGDMTLAINDIKNKPYYGIEQINALMAVNVTDDYIISNVSMYGAGILDNYGANCYGFNYDDTLIMLGQKQDTLYLTVNNDFRTRSNSAASKAWVKDVENSHGYIVVDVDNVLKNDFIVSTFREEFEKDDYYYDDYYYEESKEDKIFNELAYKAIDKISYIYLSITSPTSVELVVVMDDKQTNALKQYVDLVKPYMLTILASEAL